MFNIEQLIQVVKISLKLVYGEGCKYVIVFVQLTVLKLNGLSVLIVY